MDLEKDKKASIARQLAKHVLELDKVELPPDVIHQTKRMVLDALGCAIGGYDSESSRILHGFIQDSPPAHEATLFCSGVKTSCLNATLANGAMLRYLDYNDTAFILEGDNYRSGYHPSEVIPPILALGEWQRLPGKTVIQAINLGYDLCLAFLEGSLDNQMKKRGWNADTRAAYVIPLVAGSLLGLTEEQMENAVGISGSCHAVFGILDTAAEEYTMTKNIRFPAMSYAGIMSAMLAKRGFTGPRRMIEGHEGFIEVALGGAYDVNKLLAFKGKNTIRDVCIKSIIADFSSHGHLTATLRLAREHNIQPDDISEVIITTSKRCAEHTGDLAKKYPKNKETADHSSYYLTAIALIDREIGPDQFAPDKYSNPNVLKLIDKVVLRGDPALDKARPAGISEIRTKNGRVYRLRVDYPRGHSRNPMTDGEVIAKFEKMASKQITDGRTQKLIDTVFQLEKLEDIGQLVELTRFDRP